MKKRLKQAISLFLILTILTIGMPTLMADSYSWDGEWDTSFGTMTLTQAGNSVSGNYTFDKGKISGAVSGNKFVGTWSEAPSYKPLSDAGDIEFTMSADGKTFSGQWRYGSTGSWKTWNGTRKSAPASQPPATTSLTTIYGAQLSDQLNFKIDGNLVVPVGDDGMPVLPIIYKNTTYLPVRAVGYLLGLGIDYQGSTKTVLITSTSTKAAPQAIATTKTNKLYDISGAVLNGELKFSLDGKAAIPVDASGNAVLPITYNGTTYLPIRAIGYLLGLGIDYESSTKTVLITHGAVAQKAWHLVESKLVWPSSWTSGSLSFITSGNFLASDDVGSQSTMIKEYGEGKFKIFNEISVNGKVDSTTEYLYTWTKPQEILLPGTMIQMTVTIMPTLGDGFGVSAVGDIDSSSFNNFSISGEWNKRTYVQPDGVPVTVKCVAPSATYDNLTTDVGQKFEIHLSLISGRGGFNWVYIYEYK